MLEFVDLDLRSFVLNDHHEALLTVEREIGHFKVHEQSLVFLFELIQRTLDSFLKAQHYLVNRQIHFRDFLIFT
jgi:hypothetical protein